MSEAIKNEFVRRALNRYGARVLRAMRQEILRLDVKDRKALLNSIDYKVKASNASYQGLFQLIMADYGPFQDMGVGRGIGLKVTNGKRKRLLTQRRPRKFYSPIAYGNLNSLIGMLQFGLTDDVIDKLKE